MFKVFSKDFNKEDPSFIKGCNKVKLDPKSVELLAYDKFLFSYLFVLAISEKTVFLYNSDNKKIESFPVSDVDSLYIEKKTDLNLSIKGGRIINLTSVVGVKPKVVNAVKSLIEEINHLR